jgi:hypothetical protein
MEKNQLYPTPTLFIQLSEHQWPFHIQQTLSQDFILISVSWTFQI